MVQRGVHADFHGKSYRIHSLLLMNFAISWIEEGDSISISDNTFGSIRPSKWHTHQFRQSHSIRWRSTF